jgi:hypothetical protein
MGMESRVLPKMRYKIFSRLTGRLAFFSGTGVGTASSSVGRGAGIWKHRPRRGRPQKRQVPACESVLTKSNGSGIPFCLDLYFCLCVVNDELQSQSPCNSAELGLGRKLKS